LVATVVLVSLKHARAASLWDGDFYDPDDLKITLRRTGNSILAHSEDWDITGTIVGDTNANLAGLEGTLTSSGVQWSNGVKWTRHALDQVLPPPTWAGTYRAQMHDVEVRLELVNPTTARATSASFSTPAMGHVSGDTISMFGVRGKLRSGHAKDGGVSNLIEWTNGEVWTKEVSQGPTERFAPEPPPPPSGAGTDYWAAEFAAAAARASNLASIPSAGAVQPMHISGPAGAATAASMYPMTTATRVPPSGAIAVSNPSALSTQGGSSWSASPPEVTGASRDVAGSGAGGSSMLMPIVILMLLAAGAFAARSYKRHGALQLPLLRDDARELLSVLRRRTSQHQRVLTNEESADRHDLSEASQWLSALKAKLPEPLSGWFSGCLSAMAVATASKFVASASEGGAGIEIQFGSAEEEQLSDSGVQSPRATTHEQAAPAAPAPKSYDWDGDKLSWEVGEGVSPSVRITGHDDQGEEC